MTGCRYPLIDGWPDGYIEERAWVPVSVAATPGAAVEWLISGEYGGAVDRLHDDGMRLVATGERSWQREAPCLACEGTGADVYWNLDRSIAGPAPPCESCGGTGRPDPCSADGIAWESCSPTDDGAVEFWNLEVVDDESEAAA